MNDAMCFLNFGKSGRSKIHMNLMVISCILSCGKGYDGTSEGAEGLAEMS